MFFVSFEIRAWHIEKNWTQTIVFGLLGLVQTPPIDQPRSVIKTSWSIGDIEWELQTPSGILSSHFLVYRLPAGTWNPGEEAPLCHCLEGIVQNYHFLNDNDHGQEEPEEWWGEATNPMFGSRCSTTRGWEMPLAMRWILLWEDHIGCDMESAQVCVGFHTCTLR